MTVLVTGSGMIGSCIAKELVEEGERPVLFDFAPRPEYISDIVSVEKLDLVRGDVLDLTDLLHTIKQFGVDRIIHSAGILTVGVKGKPYAGFKVNLEGTLNVLEAARLEDIETVVFTSSSTIYTGVHAEKLTAPIDEDFAMKCLSHRPRSVYATTKLAGEYLGMNYADDYGLDFRVVRFAAAWGPWRGPPTAHAHIIFSNMVRDLLTKGVHTLDPQFTWSAGTEFLFSLDAGRGAVLASRAKSPKEKVFNIATGRLYSLQETLAIVKEVVPNGRVEVPEIRKGLFGYPFEQHQPLDITSARKELGYEPKYLLDSALRYYVDRAKQWIRLG